MKHIHFIAIGGAIMHQLALALAKQGYKVTGSDDEINDPARTNLQNAGLLPDRDGWHPEENITKDIDAIVLGMHAKADNPELLAAQKFNIPIYSFPEYVYKVAKDKKRVVIAGSHGKTTITSMVMHILKSSGIKFDYLVGAKVEGFNQSVQLTDAPIIILEGDEYPASAIEKKPKIFFYHPHISVLSGIAWDHINVFPTYENYLSQFRHYLTGINDGVTLIYNEEDEEVNKLVSTNANHLHKIAYHTPSYTVEEGQSIIHTDYGDMPTAVFGKHNLQNMQAAIQVCVALGVEEEQCYKAIHNFTGAAKRLEKIHDTPQLTIFRDFAHAPSKLKASLSAVREAYPSHHLIACFELHTYSSLSEQFLSEYKNSMESADIAYVYFSQHAIELKGLPPVDKATIAQNFGGGELTILNKKEELENNVKGAVANSSKPICLLLMSSGTFEGIDWKTVCSQH